ncbi:MAG: bifunctional hydroxymethylpyrimidine kinase/phosphomethylpyrimidine kinase [Alphaproteobacteria bacterium]
MSAEKNHCKNKGRVLVIAGSDPSGGAGIQADIKSITALGGFATTAITALTAQNTQKVTDIHTIPPEFLRAQLDLVYEDIGTDAVKLGMLHDRQTIDVVADFLTLARRHQPELIIVVDPVMVAASGARLLQASAEEYLIKRILPLASVLTPNLPEAERLLTREVGHDQDQLITAARQLRQLRQPGVPAVLLKGGHRMERMESQKSKTPSREIIDTLATESGETQFQSPRLQVRNSAHGTGCSLASAIATRLAFGDSIIDAVTSARRYIHGAIANAHGFGHGNTPLHHAWRITP